MKGLKKIFSLFFPNGEVYSERAMKKFVKEVVSKLEFGEIISAVVGSEPDTKHEEFFVVIGTNGDKLLCVSCPKFDVDENGSRTSNIFYRGSEVNCRLAPVIIDGGVFNKREYKLSEEEKKKLVKNIKFYKTYNTEFKDFKLLSNVDISERDVLKKDGKYYLVFGMSDGKYKLIALRFNSLSNIVPDYCNVFSVSLLEGYEYVNTISKNKYDNFMENYQLCMAIEDSSVEVDNKRDRNYLCDSIIFYNGRFYLIYDICGTEARAFEVMIDNFSTDNSFSAQNDFRFIAYFNNEVRFDTVKDNYKMVSGVDYSIMCSVRSARKKYLNELKHDTKKSYYHSRCKRFNIGDVIINSRFFSRKFIVVDVLDNNFVVAYLDDFMDNPRNVHYFLFSNTDLALRKCYDVSSMEKEAIKKKIEQFNGNPKKRTYLYEKQC